MEKQALERGVEIQEHLKCLCALSEDLDELDQYNKVSARQLEEILDASSRENELVMVCLKALKGHVVLVKSLLNGEFENL